MDKFSKLWKKTEITSENKNDAETITVTSSQDVAQTADDVVAEEIGGDDNGTDQEKIL